MGLANNLPGLYIVIDGMVGCGKTVQKKLLETRLPLNFPDIKFTFTYEPGGNSKADVLREKVKYQKMSLPIFNPRTLVRGPEAQKSGIR